MYNEKLHDLYSSPNIFWVIKSRMVRWTMQVACVGQKKHASRILVGKPEVKRLLGRLRHR
jgi:hypothetical protein